jgi:gamma-glutamyl-gamma-aminobutyrate hydrolase PuuD
MERTEDSETSAFNIQTPGRYQEEYIPHYIAACRGTQSLAHVLRFRLHLKICVLEINHNHLTALARKRTEVEDSTAYSVRQLSPGYMTSSIYMKGSELNVLHHLQTC